MNKNLIKYKLIKYGILTAQWGFLLISLYSFHLYYQEKTMLNAFLAFFNVGVSYQCHQLTAAHQRSIIEELQELRLRLKLPKNRAERREYAKLIRKGYRIKEEREQKKAAREQRKKG